ncbi:hypothetical protein [Bradyrhizobium elkanii]|uniref:hypothetical protein n=1 Tax=Bradyrhizobium elkanii TaxID=29448 RepID=UPI002227CE4E|nr:hypothetical protein [Bradyrhizobium elkanii]MCW2114442.1 putative HAF family extracellular repeat protein [Bradyrhizobium elkanii]
MRRLTDARLLMRAILMKGNAMALTFKYAFSTIDNSSGINGTILTGINNSGQIVGNFFDSISFERGFLYSGGSYTTLVDPSAPFSTIAAGINVSGQVVGYYLDYGGIHGFLYGAGNYTAIDDPMSTSTVPYGVWTEPLGINDLGQAVGFYVDSTVPGDNSNLSAIAHGFLYTGSSYITLDAPSATHTGVDQGTIAISINGAGQVVGYYADDLTDFHGFLYSGGKYTTLDDPLATLGGGAGEGTVATGINDLGQIVGYYEVVHLDGTTTYHGFLYSGGSYVTIDDPSGNSTFITGINDSGQIVGNYLDSNGLKHGFVANPIVEPNVSLTDHNLVVEMAELANEAYGNSTAPAVNRNWHAVSAAELSLKDSGIIGGVSYTLTDGLYEAAIPAIPGAHADALVLEGMVDGVKTLTIAFRGTDDLGDVANWPSAQKYFVDFAPLILSLNIYIAANGIEQVLATGHSLGGSMVQDLLATNIGIGTDKERGYTWGSPGANLHPANVQLVNFEHPTDPVANLGRLVGDVRVGTDVLIHNPFVSNSLFDIVGGLAHRMDIYFADTVDLADLARNSDVFATRPEGVAIQSGNFWTGNVNNFQVMPGTTHNDDVHISSRDKFVLGDAGNDTFHWDVTNFNAPPIIIDGGPGADTLWLPGSSKSWSLVTSGAETNLYFLPTHHLVAELFGVESAHFSDGRITHIPQPLLAANNSANSAPHDPSLVAGALDTPVAGPHLLPNSIHNDGWLFS